MQCTLAQHSHSGSQASDSQHLKVGENINTSKAIDTPDDTWPDKPHDTLDRVVRRKGHASHLLRVKTSQGRSAQEAIYAMHIGTTANIATAAHRPLTRNI